MKNNLQKLRTFRGLTQKQLAENANVSTDTIRRVEKNNAQIKYETKEKIADALGFTVDKIWEK